MESFNESIDVVASDKEFVPETGSLLEVRNEGFRGGNDLLKLLHMIIRSWCVGDDGLRSFDLLLQFFSLWSVLGRNGFSIVTKFFSVTL